MGEVEEGPGSYDAEGTNQLEAIWGVGFLSPGGAEEVGRIVEGVLVDGADVLDFGCGTGGAALTLAEEHGARSVVGVDVEPHVISRASAAARARGLSDRTRFELVSPGLLPFDGATFDLVFSKDSILHIEDKSAVYSEAFRLLREGGTLCVGDWFRGEGDELDAEVDAFVEASGEDFFMQTLAEAGQTASQAGFEDVVLVDRSEWYHAEATAELGWLEGSGRVSFIDSLGQDIYEGTVRFWKVLVDATARGVLRPGHVRARKPADHSGAAGSLQPSNRGRG